MLSQGPCSGLGREKEAAKGLCDALTSLDLPLFLPVQLLLNQKMLGQQKQPVKTARTELRLAHLTVFTPSMRGSHLLGAVGT